MFFRPQGLRWGVPPAGGPGFGAGFGWFRLFRLGAGAAPAVTFTRLPLTGAGR